MICAAADICLEHAAHAHKCSAWSQPIPNAWQAAVMCLLCCSSHILTPAAFEQAQQPSPVVSSGLT